MVENTLEKGEIALYEQFLLFSQCSQKICTVDSKNMGLFGKEFKDPFIKKNLFVRRTDVATATRFDIYKSNVLLNINLCMGDSLLARFAVRT